MTTQCGSATWRGFLPTRDGLKECTVAPLSSAVANSVGLMLVYLILFGGNFATLMINVSDPLTKDDFFGKQMAYVFGLGVLLIPVVIKKELQELKIISFILFATVFSFIGLTIYQISADGIKVYNADF